jgi:hypothetical protein
MLRGSSRNRNARERLVRMEIRQRLVPTNRHRQNNDTTDEKKIVHAHMLEKLLDFSHWTRLQRKPKQTGKSRPLLSWFNCGDQ